MPSLTKNKRDGGREMFFTLPRMTWGNQSISIRYRVRFAETSAASLRPQRSEKGVKSRWAHLKSEVPSMVGSSSTFSATTSGMIVAEETNSEKAITPHQNYGRSTCSWKLSHNTLFRETFSSLCGVYSLPATPSVESKYSMGSLPADSGSSTATPWSTDVCVNEIRARLTAILHFSYSPASKLK